MNNERIYKTVSMLLEQHLTGREIMAELDLTRNQFYRLKDRMRLIGINLIYNPSTKTYSLGRNRALSEDEAEIMSRIDRMKLTRRQTDSILKAFSRDDALVGEPTRIEFTKNKILFGLISDSHAGSKTYRADIMRHAAINFRRHNVDFVLNAGDTIEGLSGRTDQWLELDPHNGLGLTPQVEFLAKEFEQFEHLKVYSIEAQGSHGGWAYASHAGSQGLSIGWLLDLRIPQYKFVGYDIADVIVNGITIRLRHPVKKGLVAYIDSLMPNDKPHVLIQGHFHDRVSYEPHRNVHAINAGCMQNATPFLERQGSTPVLGYWIIEIEIGDTPSATGQTLLKDGKYVESFSAKFIPFYDDPNAIRTTALLN